MDNVVHFDFKTKKIEPEYYNNSDMIDFPETRAEFLEMCKKELLQEDYESVLCGILDEDIYQELDNVLQTIVTCYYERNR